MDKINVIRPYDTSFGTSRGFRFFPTTKIVHYISYDSLTSRANKRFIQTHTSSNRIMVRVRLVRRRRRLWLRVEEPLIPLSDHVSSLTAPVLEARKALGIRSLPSGRARIVIHIVHTAAGVTSHLPPWWQRLWSLPWRWSSIMVHIVSEYLKITA